jgi:hypothetical protein
MRGSFVAILLIAGFQLQARAAVPSVFAARGPGGGGALFSPSFSPDGSELTVSCDMSGLYHSQDAGHSWALASFQQIQAGRSSQVFWSGADLYSIDNSSGAGLVVRSPDDGATWSPVATDPTSGNGVYDVSPDPNDPNRLLATGWDSLYASRDGGVSWKGIEGEPDAGAGVLLGGVFWNGADVYLGTNGGLFVSHDSGWTFAASSVSGIPSGQRLIALTGGRKGSTVELFIAAAAVGDVYNGVDVEDFHSSTTALWTWTTGGASWTPRTTGIDPTHRLYLLGQAATTTDTLFAAGGIYQTDWPEIYRSVDGGATWTEILGATGNVNVSTGWAGSGGDRDWSYGGSACGFGVASGNGSEIAYTDYGFVHVSDDGGATWRQAYLDPADQNPSGAATPKGRAYRSAGLENTSSWTVAWGDSLHVFAGYSDIKGTLSADGGVSWGFGYSGDADNSMYCIAKTSDGKLYAATSTVHDLYESTHLKDATLVSGSGHVLVSADKGATWTTLWSPGHVVAWVAPDPSDPKTMYASVVDSATGGVWGTHNLDQGVLATWTRLSAPPRTQGHPYDLRVLSDGSVLATFSGRIDGTGAFTASSGVFRLAKGASSWQDLSDPGMKYWTKDVVVDPSDATQKTWWVGVFSGWGGAPNGLGGLYRTVDAGAHWTRVWNQDRVESVGFPPDGGTEIYATTETGGLWHSDDRTASAPVFAVVDAYPFRQPVRVLFNPWDPAEMWVTSFGNGLRMGRRDGGSAVRPVVHRARLDVVDLGSGLLVEGLPASRTLLCQLRAMDGRSLWEGQATSDAGGKMSLPMSPHGIFRLEISGVGARMVLRP